MILKNCRLIPELCEGFQDERADIRIEGNQIAEILPADGSYIGEEVIDCAGKTVLPGLFNLHCHLFFEDDPLKAPPFETQTEYMHLSNSMVQMYHLLAYGFTSIRDLGGPYGIAIKLRDDINAGKLVGPDIKACGYVLTPNTKSLPLPAYSYLFGRAVNDPYQIRSEVRRSIQEGADFIKILGNSSTGAGDYPLFYPDEIAELMQDIENEKTYLAVHCLNTNANSSAIQMCAHTIEHAHFWTTENMDELNAQGRKSTLVPTLQVCHPMGGDDLVKMLDYGLRMPYEEGILMGFGTDAPDKLFMSDPGGEFRLREKVIGFSRIDILKQATINSAIINGTDELRGSIKVGKRADFAVFDGAPDEDLSVMAVPPAYVLKDGAVVARNGYIKA